MDMYIESEISNGEYRPGIAEAKEVICPCCPRSWPRCPFKMSPLYFRFTNRSALVAKEIVLALSQMKFHKKLGQSPKEKLKLKGSGHIGNCQRLVFTVGVSQHMHKITNL